MLYTDVRLRSEHRCAAHGVSQAVAEAPAGVGLGTHFALHVCQWFCHCIGELMHLCDLEFDKLGT